MDPVSFATCGESNLDRNFHLGESRKRAWARYAFLLRIGIEGADLSALVDFQMRLLMQISLWDRPDPNQAHPHPRRLSSAVITSMRLVNLTATGSLTGDEYISW